MKTTLMKGKQLVNRPDRTNCEAEEIVNNKKLTTNNNLY